MARIKLHISHNSSLLGRPAAPRRPGREGLSLTERVALGFLFILLLAVVVMGILANWSKLLINEVVVEGALITKSDEIIGSVNKTIAGQTWPLIPRRHLWWYPAKQLKANLLSQFPRLATVKTFAEWPGRLSVVVTEREPRLLYCAVTQCAFIDETGRAYAPAPTFSPGVFLTWEASSTLPLLPFNLIAAPAVERLLSAQKIFAKVLALLKLEHFNINRLERTADGDFVFWVEPGVRANQKFKTWRVMINADSAIFDLGENLHTALASIMEQNQAKTLPALDYVDLRFGQKVFYKL